MTAVTQNELDTDLQFGPSGFARVIFRGQLNARTVLSCWNSLEQGLRVAKLEKLEVDASGLRVCDGAGLALLRYERDPYAEFLGTPEEGLVAPICELLRGDGCFSSVVGPGNLSAVKPDTLVEININQLYGDIRKPGNPCAVLAMQVMFFDATNGFPGKVILERNYSCRTPMRSATAAALMEGWNQALFGMFSEVASDFRNREVEVRTKARQGEEQMQK